MTLPTTDPNPPFAITRASHVRLQVTDLAASRHFYRDVIGLVVTEENDDVVYFRGWEETAHHSLVLERGSEAKALQIGLRVRSSEDIDAAEQFLRSAGLTHERVELPYQGATLRFVDPVGTHIELTSNMPLVERQHQRFAQFVGGAPQRLDHFQVATHDVQTATDFWASLGMRLAEFTARDGTDELWGSWLEVKGNTHDLVFTNGRGPRMHHFAYTVPDGSSLLNAADVAGDLGFGDDIDRGPGRHGISNALFLYLRDPDQHRIELFTTHYQFIDLDEEPTRWNISDAKRSQLWGMPATRRWFFEASEFVGEPVLEPLLHASPTTLEDLLGVH
ncbi:MULTISPECIES: 3,4-dihydroxyphenylacetate 2,3-dioxygenase [unclassified Microbacterium]|uniref:3,4-dihydroxyphenylacetate 2,3-dioxygenase n=1 Tax=unclassified Microbacterium TaxID=2609290 RepID=UPI000EAA5D7D|nr:MULTISPECIES: 3,4-dihydroxyphenylacetate 2,3-dioxygenase [unclassified Microbacterium]MBT2486531.1 3,4-dihydroxyphenylacetate 2,3-dioxygenase [Microbacterium sp. ISL-108]RKN69224.1 3,4-dihydroxyphenylacetate 2,3-dioxygenase [Microbacterium sp. CGR2]